KAAHRIRRSAEERRYSRPRMDVTDETFEREVLERSHELPVVVDFWAEWCGPCRLLGPVLEREARARDGAIVLAKVDVDANGDLARRYHIRGIPAVKAFRKGEVVREFVGALPPAQVAEFLDGLTGPTAAERLIDDLDASGELADVVDALRRDDFERALDLLLEAIVAADGERRQRLVAQTVALFDQLGQEHPLAVRYRRRLAATLCRAREPAPDRRERRGRDLNPRPAERRVTVFETAAFDRSATPPAGAS